MARKPAIIDDGRPLEPEENRTAREIFPWWHSRTHRRERAKKAVASARTFIIYGIGAIIAVTSLRQQISDVLSLIASFFGGKP